MGPTNIASFELGGAIFVGAACLQYCAVRKKRPSYASNVFWERAARISMFLLPEEVRAFVREAIDNMERTDHSRAIL